MLILLRHGRTAWNQEGRFQGWADVPLNDEGVAQAHRAAAEIAAFVNGPLPRPAADGPATDSPAADSRAVAGPVPVVLSSDLRRARDTAAPVAAAVGAPLIVDAALREVDVGDWEGLTRAEAEARFPDLYRRWAAGSDVRRGGGETRGEAGRRVARRIEAELRAPAGGAGSDRGRVVVVVGHGLSLQAAMGMLARRGLLRPPAAPGRPGRPDLGGETWPADWPPHLGNGCYLVLEETVAHRPDARPVGWCRLSP